MGLSLITQSAAFGRAMGVDIPHSEMLLAGHIFGASVRDSKRSLQPRTLMPASFKGSPIVTDSTLGCSRANGVRLARPLPSAFTVVSVLRNHITGVGDVNPVIGDFGITGGNLHGNGLALAGAGGAYSACVWYEGVSAISQGAYVSLAGQAGTAPAFLAGTLTDSQSQVYAGVGGEIVTSTAAVSGRSTTNWAGKPAYVGTDTRAVGSLAAAAEFAPNVLIALVLQPISSAWVSDIYRWAQEYVVATTGEAVQ